MQAIADSQCFALCMWPVGCTMQCCGKNGRLIHMRFWWVVGCFLCMPALCGPVLGRVSPAFLVPLFSVHVSLCFATRFNGSNLCWLLEWMSKTIHALHYDSSCVCGRMLFHRTDGANHIFRGGTFPNRFCAFARGRWPRVQTIPRPWSPTYKIQWTESLLIYELS